MVGPTRLGGVPPSLEDPNVKRKDGWSALGLAPWLRNLAFSPCGPERRFLYKPVVFRVHVSFPQGVFLVSLRPGATLEWVLVCHIVPPVRIFVPLQRFLSGSSADP